MYVRLKLFTGNGWAGLFEKNNRNQTLIHPDTNGAHRLQEELLIGGLTDLHSPIYPPGMEPHCSIYIGVNDVKAAVASAEEEGGKILLEPFDLPGLGRMATLQDPCGAVLSVWEETASFQGIEETGEREGAPAGVVLFTESIIQSSDFYRKVLGWGVEMSEKGSEIRMARIQMNDQELGCIVETTLKDDSSWSGWVAAYRVKSLDQSCKKAARLGAKMEGVMQDSPSSAAKINENVPGESSLQVELESNRLVPFSLDTMTYGKGPDGIPFVLVQG